MHRLAHSFHGIVRNASDTFCEWWASKPKAIVMPSQDHVLPCEGTLSYFQMFYQRHRHRIHIYPLLSCSGTSQQECKKCRHQPSSLLPDDELSMDYFFFDLETSTIDSLHSSSSSSHTSTNDGEEEKHISNAHNKDRRDSEKSTGYVIGCFVESWVDIFMSVAPTFSSCQCSTPDAIYRIRYFRPLDLRVLPRRGAQIFEPHPLIGWLSCMDVPSDDASLQELCNHLSMMLCMYQFLKQHTRSQTLMMLPIHMDLNVRSSSPTKNKDTWVQQYQQCLQQFMASDYDIGYIRMPTSEHALSSPQPCEPLTDITLQKDLPIFYKHTFVKKLFPKLWLCQSTSQYASILGSFEEKARACLFTP